MSFLFPFLKKYHHICFLPCFRDASFCYALSVQLGYHDVGVGLLLGDSGVHTLGDTSTFVNPAGQLLLTRLNPAG